MQNVRAAENPSQPTTYLKKRLPPVPYYLSLLYMIQYPDTEKRERESSLDSLAWF